MQSSGLHKPRYRGDCYRALYLVTGEQGLAGEHILPPRSASLLPSQFHIAAAIRRPTAEKRSWKNRHNELAVVGSGYFISGAQPKGRLLRPSHGSNIRLCSDILALSSHWKGLSWSSGSSVMGREERTSRGQSLVPLQSHTEKRWSRPV